MECSFCAGFSEDRIIKDYNFWTVLLHKNQCYLGRCIAALKRHAEDAADITEEENAELLLIMREARNAMKKAFSPDSFNYAFMGNESGHVHMHVVPRYSKQIAFAGLVFEDKRFGRNYSPYDKGFQLDEEILLSIRDTVKAAMKE